MVLSIVLEATKQNKPDPRQEPCNPPRSYSDKAKFHFRMELNDC